MTPSSRSTVRTAHDRFERAARGLALRLEGRPPQVVASVQPWLSEAVAAAEALTAAVSAGDATLAVPEQVARQRVATWQLAAGRAVAAAADATATDSQLADLLTRARLILHRYARHFGGQHRSTRDLGRLAEARAQLVALTRQAQPLAGHASDQALQQEARALPKFIEFLIQEQGEIADNLAASGRLDQARALGAIAATLADGWSAEVRSVHRLARRADLLGRYVQSITEVHERMNAIRHANLPDAHERAMETVADLRARWQIEWQQTQAEQALAGPSGCATACMIHANALWQTVVAEVDAGPQTETLDALRGRCDLLDEALGQLWGHAEATVLTATTASLVVTPTEALMVELRDALIWLGQRYDQRANPA